MSPAGSLDWLTLQKAQQEYNKSKGLKAEDKLKEASKTVNTLRERLEELTGQSLEAVKPNNANRNSICMGDLPQSPSVTSETSNYSVSDAYCTE